MPQYLAPTEDEVYLTLKNICDQQSEEAVINYLQILERFSQYYEQFIDPNLCPVPGIRNKLEALFLFKPNLVDNCVQAFPRYLSKNEESLRRARRLTNNICVEKNLSSLISYEFCQKVTAFFGISSDEYGIQIEGGSYYSRF